MEQRRDEHEHRYWRLHVADHDYGGNDIHDHNVYHIPGDDDRTDHDIAGDDKPSYDYFLADIQLRRRNDGSEYLVAIDDRATGIHLKHDTPRYLNVIRAVYDAAARILGTDGAADKPDDLDALRAAYIDAHALYAIVDRPGVTTQFDAARDALCAALRKAPSHG